MLNAVAYSLRLHFVFAFFFLFDFISSNDLCHMPFSYFYQLKDCVWNHVKSRVFKITYI